MLPPPMAPEVVLLHKRLHKLYLHQQDRIRPSQLHLLQATCLIGEQLLVISVETLHVTSLHCRP